MTKTFFSVLKKKTPHWKPFGLLKYGRLGKPYVCDRHNDLKKKKETRQQQEKKRVQKSVHDLM